MLLAYQVTSINHCNGELQCQNTGGALPLSALGTIIAYANRGQQSAQRIRFSVVKVISGSFSLTPKEVNPAISAEQLLADGMSFLVAVGLMDEAAIETAPPEPTTPPARRQPRAKRVTA